MAKKTKNEEYIPEQEINEEEYEIDTDFDIDEEYVPPALIPSGTYTGAVTDVKIDAEALTIAWKVTFSENGGVKSDQTTPIDGSVLPYTNWLPRPGDEDKLNKSGSATIRQSKISFLKQFQEAMGINMNSMSVIKESIANGDWIGLGVRAKVGISEYNKVFFNRIDELSKA